MSKNILVRIKLYLVSILFYVGFLLHYFFIALFADSYGNFFE